MEQLIYKIRGNLIGVVFSGVNGRSWHNIYDDIRSNSAKEKYSIGRYWININKYKEESTKIREAHLF